MKSIMSLVAGLAAIASVCFFVFADQPAPTDVPAQYADLKAQAEKYFAEHSYAKAHELYQQAAGMNLPAEEKRWVAFRVADTSWRAQAGTQTADSTAYDAAREQLDAIINAVNRAEDRDRIWAEANESLGDFWWLRRDSQNWGQAWPYYERALDWWAGSSDLDLARSRYLSIVWRLAEPPWVERGYSYYYWTIPLEILDNALKIAQTADDRAHAHYLIAMNLRGRAQDWRQMQRIAGEFEGAIEAGKSVDWYDDALFNYGQWLMNEGRPVLLDSGQWTRQQDYVAALAVFQRFVREFRKGESRYYDQALQAIKSITAAYVQASVTNIFLPGSEIQYQLAWRNVKQIELTLYRVQLTRDIRFASADQGVGAWLDQIDLSAAEKVRSWTKDTQDKGDYRPGQSIERLDPSLETGAYVLTATAGGKSSRALIAVTDAAVILKVAGDRALTLACDALNSAPIPGATVRLWRFVYTGDHWVLNDASKQADDQGLCLFEAKDFPPLGDASSVHYLAVVESKGRQAFASTYAGGRPGISNEWRIYAFTDRPAYRPEEKVQWKFIAREHSQDGFATPANQSIWYQIDDPRGAKVGEGEAKLNAFGSAWGSLDLTSAMPLGEYRVMFWRDSAHNYSIGAANLFRLEEYKLPEFKVSIKTPEENGKPKAFVLGETVDVTIQSDYYFGGPVANATVEVVVHQAPYFRWWAPPREYPWLYEDANPSRWWGGGGDTIVKRETLKTDAEGKTKLSFDTPANSQQDFEYRIEARVTDASRREITANESVRVTRQRYYVYPRAEHNIYKPNDKVEIAFKAMDANNQPVQVEGAVKVTREEWIEIWIDPQGNEVTGDALREAQEKSRVWPPMPPADRPFAPTWRVKFRGYKSEEILSTTVKLDAKGEAPFTFTPGSVGYYKVSWFSKDMSPMGMMPITAETSVWVTTRDIAQLGYRSGGVEIIVDKDTARVGQPLPVMISTPTNDRYVLFSVEGNDLYSYQVVHVTGNVKLIQVPLDQRHVPNIYLNAMLAHGGQLHQDVKEVVVPPVEQYLTVDVSSDREQYQPGEEGQFTIKTTDHDGKPVSAEIALAVVDEAVTYIQQDYAGDPRAYFVDRKQYPAVQTGSTPQQMAYIKLVRTDKDQLIDERQRAIIKNAAEDEEVAAEAGQEDDLKLGIPTQTAGGRAMMPMAVAADAGYGVSKSLRMSHANVAEMAAGIVPPPPPEGQEPTVVVRSDFRSTLVWQPAIVTDETGIAKISLKYADSLTTWKATARAAGKGQQFGIGSAATRTKMPLIARLQAPRFFLVGDTVTVSGVINNNTDAPQTVTPQLDAEGLTIVAMLKDGQPTKGLGTVEIPANGEARVDWQVAVESPGAAKLKLTAKSKMYADAMERTFTVYEHGVEKFIAKSGKVRGNDVTVKLNIPAERKVESTALMVQVSPSMAVTMLDALPYLIDYPYGCTEQTMSRFLPAAITARTLRDLGLKPEAAMAKVFGGIEQATAEKTHPKGKKDLAQLDQITQASLDRLYGFQHDDGGWGWWKDGESDHFMTAYVLWGLCLAHDAGLDVREDAMQRAAAYLDHEIVELETEPDMQAWVLHALAAYHHSMRSNEISEFARKAIENLWNNRDGLNAYTRALYALAVHDFGDEQKAKTLVENLLNGVKRDDRPDASVIVKGADGANQAVMGTAHWGEDGVYWRWSDGGVEATAFALKAMLAIDPKNALIEPVTNWLVKNRRGAQWSSTRDTAIAVLALNDYLRVSGELSPDLEYELFVNGKSVVSKKLTAEDALSAPTRYAIDRELIRNGDNDVRIVRKSGSGPIYFAAEATFFSKEEPVTAAGNEIFVRREYYKLVPRPTLLKGYVYDRLPLADGGTVASGERVEVVMTIEAKNNYEYLVFEDLKPAGLEAAAVRSGEPLFVKEMKSGAVQRTFGDGNKDAAAVMAEQAHGDEADYTGRNRWVYQELRDRKVAMFIDKLPEGVWELRYDLRAETPGRFHALPVMGYAMYVPEIKCNSGELRLSVTEPQ